MQQAREAPSVNIALNTSSEGERVDRGANFDPSGLTPPLHPPTAPRPPLSNRALSGDPLSGDPLSGGPLRGEGPPSGDDPVAAFTRNVRRHPSTTLKIAIAVGGIVAVLLAFGILTVLKMAGQSMGVLPSGSAEPSTALRPAAPAVGKQGQAQAQGPSTAVTVTLDAGRAPP